MRLLIWVIRQLGLFALLQVALLGLLMGVLAVATPHKDLLTSRPSITTPAPSAPLRWASSATRHKALVQAE